MVRWRKTEVERWNSDVVDVFVESAEIIISYMGILLVEWRFRRGKYIFY
jgi:hypothetical protein